MPEVPDCLRRRYKALDELVDELNSVSHIDLKDDTPEASWNDPGIRLMCEFWNILKENPDCNLTRAIQNHLDVGNNSMYQPQRFSCYMATHNCLNKDEDKRSPDPGSGKNTCCHSNKEPDPKPKCCASKSQSSNKESNVVLPLSQVLCNLKEAASFDRKCQGMISDLMSAQKTLQDQIQHLEQREKEGVQLLKQADCMWSCMEEAYKKKIQESQDRQQELIKQLKDAEANANKWRKNKKDLEFQFENIEMCHQEIFEKLNQKQNDLKCMNVDIAGYKQRIENNKKEVEAAKKSLSTKKQASEDKIKKILGDIAKKEALIRDEKAHKEEKENEGNQYIKEARADLLNLNRILLQKKIENEDMKTEKETLIDELELLSQSYDQCKDRCQSKKQSIQDEIKVINKEIANYKVKCTRCHQCTDTIDIRKFCTDCPRCVAERECLYSEDHCNPDHSMDCVCLSVKQKFLDNVFENMYTVLERQIRTGPGKAVAEAVIQCLKKSRNGKLDQSTRQILQDFILTTVKKNLNLTIVGGAVKTRCELDSDTYKQLMLCLKQVKPVRPPKADKETAAKKDPCPRWGGASECNCPKGPKACICTKKAPLPPTDPAPCPPQDKEDAGKVKVCPHKESAACGPDCAMHAVPSAVGTDVAAWRPDPCQGITCQFKNMRAAQCVLGPEALNAISSNRNYVTTVPYVPRAEDQVSCKCESSSTKSCVCKTDVRSHPREKIIEEVMGNYFELTPIEKVSATKEYNRNDVKNNIENNELSVCVGEPVNISYCGSIISSDRYNLLYPEFRDHLVTTDRDKILTDCEPSKYNDKDIRSNHACLSLKSFDLNQCSKMDSTQFGKLYPETKQDGSMKSSRIQVAVNHIENSNKVMDNNDFKNVVDKKSIYSLKVKDFCKVAQKLINDIIVSDYKLIANTSKEWIKVDRFVHEILNRCRIVDNKDKNNSDEIEIKSVLLETEDIRKNKERNIINNVNEMDSIYKNTYYSQDSSKNNMSTISLFGVSLRLQKESNKTLDEDIKQMKSDVRIQCANQNCNKLPNNFQKDDLFVGSPNVLKNDFAVDKEDSKISNKTRQNLYSSKESISVDSHVKHNLIKEQFKPLLISNSIQDDKAIFEKDGNVKKIQRKASEQSEVLKEINEKVMDLIESITKQDPNSFVSLKKTKSGHLTIGLNSVVYDNGKTILMKRSHSGNMIIELTESTIETLKNSKNNIEFNPSLSESSVGKKTDEIVVGASKSCNEQCNKKTKLTENDVTKFLLDNLKEDFKMCKAKKQILSVIWLQDMYKKGQRNIRVRIIYKNKWVADEQATLIQTPSENVMIHVKEVPGVRRTIKEIPVLLYKTESDTVNVCLDEQAFSTDTFATKKISEGLLISKKRREPPVAQEPLQQNETKTEKLAKIKLKGLDSAITEPPVVIEQTPSGNYDIILEKEFEKCYKEAIKRQMGGENESFFEIINTSSSIVLDFDKIDRAREESKKAFLIKSNSGVLKIIVSDSTHGERVNEEKAQKRKTVASGSTMSAKALRELLRQMHEGVIHKSTPYNAISKKLRSCSDSYLYKTSKIKLQSSQRLLHNSSNTLRRTPSGKYAIILDKESKQTFINNLISLLDKSSENAIPVSRTDSGEITIVFNKDTSNMGNYNSLKVTRSGNIYVVLDGADFKRTPNNVSVNTASASRKSVISPYISQIVNPADKSIATTCNARPDDSLCDSCKCACERFHKVEDSIQNIVSLDSWSSSNKFCGQIKCLEFSDNLNIESNRSPHIVIRPCESRSVSDKHARIEESYYCEVQPVCPYHIDRYDAVSNELLEISGLCNKAQEKRALTKITTHRKARQLYGKTVKSGRDTLDFLPPQLPSFLRNITNVNYN